MPAFSSAVSGYFCMRIDLLLRHRHLQIITSISRLDHPNRP